MPLTTNSPHKVLINNEMTMNKNDLRIVFFGTPEFAVESLKRLVDGGYNVVGVVTMPDKTGGRGNKVIESPVKRYAVEHGLHLMQPAKLKDETFVAELRSLQADLQIIIAFRMLPEVVWAMPPLGTFNLHASLLPKYRGAAPINWAVMNGDTTTGVTTFFLKHEIDTGDIIQQRSIEIGRKDNVEVVYDRLMMMGADMVIETVDAIIAGTVRPIPQSELLTTGEEPTPAPKIYTDTCRIDWSRSAEAVYNHIRGLSPYPAAWTTVRVGDGEPRQLKVYATAEPEALPVGMKAGDVKADGKSMHIACADGMLALTEVQIAGKRRMAAPDFLRGLHDVLTIVS